MCINFESLNYLLKTESEKREIDTDEDQGDFISVLFMTRFWEESFSSLPLDTLHERVCLLTADPKTSSPHIGVNYIVSDFLLC